MIDKKELVKSLREVQQALSVAQTGLESLNEALSELDDFILDEEDAPAGTLSVKHELHKLYRSLPTWDEIDVYVTKIEKAINEMEGS